MGAQERSRGRLLAACSDDRLVWFERHETMESAIVRERRLKGWRRAWKLELIEAENPVWRDLYWEIL